MSSRSGCYLSCKNSRNVSSMSGPHGAHGTRRGSPSRGQRVTINGWGDRCAFFNRVQECYNLRVDVGLLKYWVLLLAANWSRNTYLCTSKSSSHRAPCERVHLWCDCHHTYFCGYLVLKAQGPGEITGTWHLSTLYLGVTGAAAVSLWSSRFRALFGTA